MPADTSITTSLPPDATSSRLSPENVPSVVTSEPPDAVSDTSAGKVTCTGPRSPLQPKKLNELFRRISSVLPRTSVTISAASVRLDLHDEAGALAQEEIDAATDLDGVEPGERTTLPFLRVGRRRQENQANQLGS